NLTSHFDLSKENQNSSPTVVRPAMNQESLDMMEYPFLTMSKYPPGFILHLGGTVSSRSVKLLERITNLEEPETRDAWWTEIRMEVRSHARALGCNVSAQFLNQIPVKQWPISSVKSTVTGTKVRHPSEGYDVEQISSCSVCHIPYSESSVPFRVTMLKCAVCRRGKVPDVLFTTIELPEGVPITGKACFLQAYVCRPKRDCRGELNAKEISDGLPFLEYELHRLLINKLKMKGMNSIFGLKVQVSIGEKLLVGLASGTKLLQDTVKKNREFYQLKPIIEPEIQTNGKMSTSDTEESDDELPDLDLAMGNKDTCVLELDRIFFHYQHVLRYISKFC
ncbi:hypothetical protein L9F63_026180, partial [Diploptera punctata]